jgi:phosphoenolpyruvate carboxykinase (GTP)
MATAPQHVTLASLNLQVSQWVDEVARLTQPDQIFWCDGSEAEFSMLERELVAEKELLPLNQASYPGCYLYRSHPSDVARVEHLTFVCTREKDDAGPNNHWMAPAEAHRKMDALFDGCMKGRTLYVVPYCMGPSIRPSRAAASRSRTAPMWCST